MVPKREVAMYYDWIQQHKRQIIVLGSSLLAILIIWSTILFISHIGKLPVVIKTVPDNATIHINSSSASNGTMWLTPGKYTVTVDSEGFVSRKETLVVTNIKKQNVVAVALAPSSESAKEWATKHSQDYKDIEQYGSIEANNNGLYIAKAHPITNVLPIEDPYYQIRYTITDDDTVSITIATPSPRYRYYALQKIRDLGYNPTDYRIEFVDFKNPLETPRA